MPKSMAAWTRFLSCSRLAPSSQMDRAHHQAEYVGRNEAQLVCFEADDADQDAIETGQSPAFPATSPH